MNLATFYLVCFAVGFACTLLGFLGSSLHIHLPGLHLHHGHVHFGAHAHGPHAGSGANGLSWFNFSTLVAFLAWFGGTGYVLTHYGHVQLLLGLVLAAGGGLFGAGLVFWFLVKLISFERALDGTESDLVGIIGRINVPIREGGTGEIVFSHSGTRKVSGARSDDGTPLAKGTEVVITRYERGLAYVRPWEEFAEEGAAHAAQK